MLAVVLWWWQGWGLSRVLCREPQLSLFLRAGFPCPFPSYTCWRARVAGPECAFPYRSQAGAWPGARGVWAARTGLGGWVCPAFQPRHVPHAASACVCPEGLVVSPAPVAAGGCSKVLPVLLVVEEFTERAGRIECPCPGWLVQSSVLPYPDRTMS